MITRSILILTSIVVLFSTSAIAGKATCEDKCATVATKKISACNGVEQCVSYEQSEYQSCIRACKDGGK